MMRLSLLRFGIFDFDPETRQLRRDGEAVHLQAQPAQVLAFLLSHAGELVSRESLHQEVWKDGTFVDFDRGLNFCVAQIRSALGDSAESPRFIKTLPKRGYQFIAPVGSSSPSGGVQEAAPEAVRPKRLNPWIAASIAGALLLSTVLVWRWVATRGGVDPNVVAVVRFDNETGDPGMGTFADGLTDLVVAELTTAGDGKFSVIGNAAILRLPRPQRDLTAIGKTLGAGYVVLGQVQQSDSRIRVLAHVIRLPQQKHLRVTRADFDRTPTLEEQTALARRIATELSAAKQRRQ